MPLSHVFTLIHVFSDQPESFFSQRALVFLQRVLRPLQQIADAALMAEPHSSGDFCLGQPFLETEVYGGPLLPFELVHYGFVAFKGV